MVDDSAVPEWPALLALQQAAHVTAHALAAQLGQLALTGAEINAVAHLAAGRGRMVSELATAAGVPSTTMTSVVDRLERRGLVSRGTVPGDRRAVRVELTAQGRSAAGVVGEAIRSLERRALASLPAEVIEGLRSGLAAFAEVPR